MIEGYLRRLGLMDAGGPVDYLDPQRMNLAKSWPTSGAIDSGLNPQMTRPVRSSFPNPADYADEPPSRIGQAIDDYRAGKRDDTGAMLASAATNVASMPLKMMTLEGMYGLGKSAYDAFMTPYRVLTSPEPVTTEQMIEPAADMAMMAPLGGVAAGRMAPAERVAYSNSKEGAVPGLLSAGDKQGITAYHGASSAYKDDVYNPRKSQYRAFFAAESPDLANSFARSYGDSPRVYPVTISDTAKIFDPKGNPAHGQMLAEAIDANPGLVAGSLMGKDTIRRLATEGDGGIMEMSGVQQWLKRKGFDGWKFEDTAANPGIENRASYGMLKPGHVKSSITGETLYSNSKEGTLPGLLRSAQAGEQLPMDTASRMKRAQEMGFDTERVLYHQTHKDNVDSLMRDGFDFNRIKAARDDEQMPVGAFLKPTDADIGVGGHGAEAAQIPVLTRMTNPHVFRDRDHLASFLKRDPQYAQMAEDLKLLDQRRAGEWDAVWNKNTVRGDKPAFEAKKAELDRILAEWNKDRDAIALPMKAKADAILKSTGHDGLVVQQDAGGFNKKTHTTVVYDPSNIRSVNAAFDPAQSHSPNLLASNPKESALVSALAGEQMQQPGKVGFTVYHGSPHEFPPVNLIQMPDGTRLYQNLHEQPNVPAGAKILEHYPLGRFDMSKIGTGEGAQAYGHGLYFAENEGVAKSYRDTVRNQWSSLDPETKPGHMYEVRINADPEHFLDWDKPLSQQSERVREALAKQGVAAPDKNAARAFDDALLAALEGDANVALPKQPHDPAGEQIIRQLYSKRGSSWLEPNKSAEQVASQALRDAGIPGIKYLDQGSRTAGEGSRNFVVFDDKLISIVRKYGWAGAAAMLGMSADDLMAQAQAAEQQPVKPDPYREALRMKARAKALGINP